MKLWRRCGFCNKDFLTESDACPNNVGHVLIVMSPQPEEVLPTSEPQAPEEPGKEEQDAETGSSKDGNLQNARRRTPTHHNRGSR